MTNQTPQGWGPPQPPARKPRRRPGVRGWIGIIVGGLVLLFIVIGAIAGGNQTSTAARRTDLPAATTVTTSPPTIELATTTTEAPTTIAPTTRRATPTTRKPTPTTRRPATTQKPPQTTSAPARNCDPAYPDACLHDGIGDYDCAGGSGNGPNYVEGPITVRAPDPFGLDSDHDGVGCES